MPFQALCPALSPLLDTPACQPLPSTSITRLHRYYGLIRLPVPHPQNLVPSVPSTPFTEEGTGPPRFLENSLNNMPWTMTPVEYPLSASNDSFVAAFSVLNHLGLLHNISVFGAEHLHPCGLRPAVALFTLHPYSYLHRCKTRF